MRIHNFLVDYRDKHNDTASEVVLERRIFTEDISNSEEEVMVVGNDERVRGRRTNDYKENRVKGLQLRDKLRIALMNHDMHRPRRIEWSQDENNYAIRL